MPGAIPDGSYLTAPVKAGEPATLAAAGRVMRFRFQMPTTPPTPCATGCSRTGNEQLRYMSLSFENGTTTLASLADNYFTQNANGDVTLIVGTGATIPSWITAANGYTFFDLTAVSGYANLAQLNLRNLVPAATFNCSGEMVPYDTAEYTPGGGLMGQYAPYLDYPLASSLATTAGAPPSTGACAVFPDGEAGLPPTCGVVTPQPVNITGLSTQCAVSVIPATPGCSQVVVQPQPPMASLAAASAIFRMAFPSPALRAMSR